MSRVTSCETSASSASASAAELSAPCFRYAMQAPFSIGSASAIIRRRVYLASASFFFASASTAPASHSALNVAWSGSSIFAACIAICMLNHLQ